MCAVLVGVPGAVLSASTGNAELISSGVQPLRTMMLMTPIVGIQVIGYFYYLGIGRGLLSLFLSVSRSFLFLVPLVLALPLWLGVSGVWLAYPVADVLSVVVTGLLLYRSLRAARGTTVEPGLLNAQARGSAAR
jgi:Na+-driven multidrug efflux pump